MSLRDEQKVVARLQAETKFLKNLKLAASLEGPYCWEHGKQLLAFMAQRREFGNLELERLERLKEMRSHPEFPAFLEVHELGRLRALSKKVFQIFLNVCVT